MLAAPLVGGFFGDQRPAGRNVCAHREADDQETGNDHPWRHRENEHAHAQRVDEHVILVDPLAPEFVAEPAADQRADAGADRIRSEGGDEADKIIREIVEFLPQRERRGASDDRPGVDIIGETGEDRVPPIVGLGLFPVQGLAAHRLSLPTNMSSLMSLMRRVPVSAIATRISASISCSMRVTPASPPAARA
jgi:hypothetical protein